MRALLWAVIAALGCHEDATAQAKRRNEEGRGRIRVDATRVLINVTVLDPLNRMVQGLEKEHFRVFEERVEQPLDSVAMVDAPISIGLVFDTSGSMHNKLVEARLAAARFLATSGQQDEFLVIEFNDRARVTVPFTPDPNEPLARLGRAQARGKTALLDAIYLGLDAMRGARNRRKALLLLSDGGDNSSRYSGAEVRDRLRESDVQLYAMGIFEASGTRRRSAEELLGPDLLSELAAETGGRHFELGNVAELPEIAERIGDELRSQYELAYRPTNERHDGKYRRVQVKLAAPEGMPRLRAYFRMGYYAPVQ